jgi:hypothetical protein
MPPPTAAKTAALPTPMPILVLTLIDRSLLVVTLVAKATLEPTHEVTMKVIEVVRVQVQHRCGSP